MKKHRKLLTLGVVICLVAGLVAGIVYYKQVEEERKLSLIYIPKVVDGTNDFWTSHFFFVRKDNVHVFIY